jgi:ion channel
VAGYPLRPGRLARLAIAARTVVAVSLALALFGLLTFALFAPLMKVALKGATAEPLELLFFGLLYAFGWLFVAVLEADALSYMYRLRRPWISSLGWGITFGESGLRSPSGALTTAIASFALTLYGYSVIYVYVSHLSANAFHPGPLGVVDAAYFTVITAATVGFGDIYPSSATAKLLVVSEVVWSFFYVIVVISTAASAAARPRSGQGPDN